MSPRPNHRPLVLFTVGHSTRSLQDFIELLRVHRIQQVADVRTIPRSRHNPQFNTDTLAEALRTAGIHYSHWPELGGLRHAHRDSPNTGWRNPSFRGFADYMQQPEFASGIEKLMKAARTEPAALMCAEAVPWRCHRSLIADALAVRGAQVEHILSGRRTQTHQLTPFACVQGLRIVYPGEALSGSGPS